ncbi:uncharacterized protein LOC107620359 [Arachis ipaensis]|uniref:uncharacterized protein LOC107620359 n=1 Tax=Arachis ipaensis TaxID=130454 RepID=UPI0007AF9D23|nr:uncharacterized protein LOC107620359 [Arachis ipaensis]
MDKLNFDRGVLHNKFTKNFTEMNVDQGKAFEVIMKAVDANDGGFFFIYGYGGTGKTYLYKILSVAIRSRGEIVLNVACSSIASLFLPNGRIAHSRFKIPFDLNEDSVFCIKQGTLLCKLVCKAKLIIWDEAPMLNKLCYEALDKCLMDILRFEPYYNTELPFRRKVVVLGGDFRQILPVIPMDSTTLKDVDEFATWLLGISDGLTRDSTDGESIVLMHDEIDRSILAPTLEVVNEVNAFIMQHVNAGEKTCLSSDTLCMEEGNMKSELDTLSQDVLNAINCSGLLPHELTLKVGVPVMLLRNIDQSNGLCNRIRLQVRRLGNHVIECITLTGDKGQTLRLRLFPRTRQDKILRTDRTRH